ncbi:MAG: hypothetical protein JWN72_2233 [Thermoleophilia bacterium]|nr:hypothetical protein [Thermoleophilia bacterium]
MPQPRQLIELVVAFVAATLLPTLRLDPELTGRLGDIDPLAALGALVATLAFAVRLQRMDRWGWGLLVIEGAGFALVGPTTVELWAIAAGWSILAHAGARASGREALLAARPATRCVVRGMTAGLVAAALLAAGIEGRRASVDFGELFTHPLAVLAIAGAAALGVGITWGEHFAEVYGTGGERAWLLWLLWPSAGAICLTYLAREELPTWALMCLIAITLATIMGHALVATQRPRAEGSGPNQLGPHLDEPPSGGLLEVVQLAPSLTTLLVSVIFAAAGVARLLA